MTKLEMIMPVPAQLKERSWFDVPLVYANHRRAIIGIEKGPSGEQAFKDAFEWSPENVAGQPRTTPTEPPPLPLQPPEPARAEVPRTGLPPQPPGFGTENGILGVLPASSVPASPPSQAMATQPNGEPRKIKTVDVLDDELQRWRAKERVEMLNRQRRYCHWRKPASRQQRNLCR